MHRAHLTLNNFSEETSDSRSTALRNSSHNSFGTDSPAIANSPDHISDSLSETSKKIRKKRNTYQKIDDASRMRLLDAVQQGETLKAAAKRQGINYSSAKSILHTYRKEGRIFKKSAQERIAKKRTKASSDLEMSPIYPYKQQFQGFDGVSESPAGFNAMEFQQKTQMNGLGEGNTNGVTINSFGDFLKVDSQGRTKSDNAFPSSTITLKLDAQKFQRLPATNNVSVPTLMFNNAAATNVQATTTPQCVTNNTRNIQSGNWQLNVNVRTEDPQKNTKSLNLKDGSQFTYTYTTRPAETATRNPEPFSVNFTTSMKKDVPEYDPRFVNKQYESANHMITNGNTGNQYPQEEQQNYDVSCFLNSSSPAYSFPQRANNNAAAMEQVVDNSGENNTHQEYYGKYEGNYLNSFGQKLEQGTPGMLKTASLRSY